MTTPKKKRIIPGKTRIRNALRRVWLQSPERAAALRATGYRCSDCGVKQSVAKGREVKLQVHHIDEIDWDRVNAHESDQLLPDVSRLAALCKDCHKARHAKGHDDDAE